ncbi:MAG: BASS family bile acid:Na+ symporter [Paraglaciecola sp.]|jgi:BASS family bile acid:Na+ symporter
MTGSLLTEFILPLVLAIIMFGMGLSLTRDDFRDLFKVPKPIFVGLFGQLLLLPAIAYGVAIVFDLPEHLAIGLMILAACPGGTASNVISHLARANLALSVSLTAVTTVICVFSTPLIIRFAVERFSESPVQSFSLLSTTIGLIFITLLPVSLGILLRHNYSALAIRVEPLFRKLAGVFLVAMIVAVSIQERETILDSFSQVFAASISLNFIAIGTGVLLGVLFKLLAKDSVTLGIEVGIQNAAVAILIAITFLNRPDYAISAGVYGVTMYIGAGLLVLMAKRFR